MIYFISKVFCLHHVCKMLTPSSSILQNGDMLHENRTVLQQVKAVGEWQERSNNDHLHLYFLQGMHPLIFPEAGNAC